VVIWTTPQQVELSAYVAALQPLIPEGPALDPFIETAELEGLARRAGLKPKRTFEADWSWEYPDRDTMLRGLLSPGLSAVAIDNFGEETVNTLSSPRSSHTEPPPPATASRTQSAACSPRPRAA
jgi:hypothetical protein